MPPPAHVIVVRNERRNRMSPNHVHRVVRWLRTLVALTLVGVVVTAVAPATAQTVTITDLGTFGVFEAIANDINDQGQVVVQGLTERGSSRAFLWSAQGGGQDLGTLGGASVANDINDQGQVVGWSSTASGEMHAFVWSAQAGMQDLGTLGGESSEARGINNQGQVVGWSETTSFEFHAVLWTLAASSIEVQVAISPGSGTATINLKSAGIIPVAILSTARFDATTIDPRTICFGDAEDDTQRDCSEEHGKGHWEDVDGDGDTDLVLHFETQQTGIDLGDTQACLSGTTRDGQTIQGCDTVHARN
jgi:probable HAF family extracellular repeat protein